MPTAARTAQPDNDAALAAAYARLSDDDSVTGPITVRALREAAGVSSKSASDWLKAHRAAQKAPGPVPDDLASLVPLHDLWARAVRLARDEVHTKHVVALADAHDAKIIAEQAAAAAAQADASALREALAMVRPPDA